LSVSFTMWTVHVYSIMLAHDSQMDIASGLELKWESAREECMQEAR
uniref:Cytochrome b n=1 Tax=Toxocara canis TaxID=6265 RepID=A0A183UV68_TOXCA